MSYYKPQNQKLPTSTRFSKYHEWDSPLVDLKKRRFIQAPPVEKIAKHFPGAVFIIIVGLFVITALLIIQLIKIEDQNANLQLESQLAGAAINDLSTLSNFDANYYTFDVDQELIDAINRHRVNNNLPELKTSSILNTSASLKSNYMTRIGCFEHGCGSEIFFTLEFSGLTPRQIENIKYRGENLAEGYQGDDVKLLEAWKKSARHNEILLNADAKYVGIGRAYYEDGRELVVLHTSSGF